MTSEPREERERRVFINLLAAIALLLLAIAGFWLLKFLDQSRRLQACLEAGRRDCAENFVPAEK